ncbi:MAG: cell division protein FtsK [Candidatus Puniceispirillum sp.]|nr:cell division protein FtsK [Candidatus Pelagibacter sp.]MBA4282951.1 cell division protein FtsK [Candidatus Puniceispirillum sp.]
MSKIKRQEKSYSFFSKFIYDIKGFILLTLAIVIGLSVFFYNDKDPSLNTSSYQEIENILGGLGSSTADLFLQIFGLTSYIIIFSLVVWGIQSLFFNSQKSLTKKIFFSFLFSMHFGLLLGLCTQFSEKVIHHIPSLSNLSYYGGFISLYSENLWNSIFYPLGFKLKSNYLEIITLASLSVIFLWLSLGLNVSLFFQIIYKILRALFLLISYCIKTPIRLASAKYSDKNMYVHHDEVLEEENHIPLNTIYEQGDTFVDFDWATKNTDSSEDLETSSDLDEEHESVEDHSAPNFDNVIKPHKKKISKTKSEQKEIFSFFSGEYSLPPIELLDKTVLHKKTTVTNESIRENAQLLQEALNDFGIKGEIENIKPGPVVTMYEVKPAPGIKSSRVISLADDIARSMSALSARIAGIPGKNVIGIELPNKNRQTVYLRELLSSNEYQSSECALPLILGLNIGGLPIIADLAKMPHLLVAGTTGSGKSVSVNAMILSLLFKLPPSKCKLIMIDPKMLELSVYDDIPHLLTPVVTDPKKAVVALKWAVKEMEDRYRSMSKLGVRNIDGFNERLAKAKREGEILSRKVQTGFDPETGKPIFENQNLGYAPLPYIVIVVDEMADLMMVSGKEIEATIQRLAQMARAAGIHLIMATQRPSVDVITGTIKANFPTRISFQVTSKIDSRTILGEMGGEQLLGQGDMLYMSGAGRINRVHGPYVRDDEVERIVSFLKEQQEPDYIENITVDEEAEEEQKQASTGDEIYDKAVDLIVREGKVSTSFIQRHLQIGYNRAARIVEQMEKEGLISEANHVGKRQILK